MIFLPLLIESISNSITDGNFSISNNLLNLFNYLLNLLVMVEGLLAMALLAMNLTIIKNIIY